MRIFVAGASGVLGVRIVPLLVAGGHVVAGMTRSQAELVATLGAEPVVCDAYDAPALREAVRGFAPDLVVHQLTDLPDEEARIDRAANARMRTEGTRNLVAAADGVRLLAQSVAFPADVAEHERLVLATGGTVLRYGRLYGPGTYYPAALPEPPRIHVDDAARRTVEALDAPPGVLELVD
jgi:nucleoside-diphosphate-sugar epimerase